MNWRYDLGSLDHNSRPSMIVHYLNFKRVAFNPAKADPPLVVDPTTVLTSPIAGQSFQPIPRNRSQVGNGCHRVNVIELPFRHHGDTLKLPAELAPEDLLSFLVPEHPDHDPQNYRDAFNQPGW